MHPLSAFLFLLCGLGLLTTTRRDNQPAALFGIRTSRTCGWSVLILAGSKILAALAAWDLPMERMPIFDSARLDRLLKQGMPTDAVVCFFCCGLALVCFDSKTRRGFRPAQAFIIATAVLALMATVMHSYRFLSIGLTGGVLPMALPSSIAFLIWCGGALAARPDYGVLNVINSPTSGGAMARRLIPLAIVIPWLIGALRWAGETRGFYGTEFGVALFTVLIVLVFSAVIWWNASLLHRADLKRKRAEELRQQTARDLERSNEDLKQFAYVASHDLFEPLRMITSYLQLLQQTLKGKLEDDARDYINYAVDGARRMHALITDLLAYSRVGSREAPMTQVKCDDVLQAALSNLKVAIEESAATIIASPLPQVTGDAVQLTQVFQNLIGNAIKFRSAEPPRIDIGAEKRPKEWVIHFRDNGIGISPEHFERVFVIFQRLHTRREYPGTGMGLAICKRIVERHGGRIWVDSTPGQGSTFFISLPDPAPAKPVSETPEAAGPSSG